MLLWGRFVKCPPPIPQNETAGESSVNVCMYTCVHVRVTTKYFRRAWANTLFEVVLHGTDVFRFKFH